jgi:hypothetical protein
MKKIQAILKIVERLQRGVINEFSYLEKLRDEILSSGPKIALVRDKKKKEAVKKSLARHARKITRRAGNIEKKVNALGAELLKLLGALPSYLPQVWQDAFTQQNFVTKIQTEANTLLRYVAKNKGVLPQQITPINFEPGRFGALLTQVENEGIRPYLAELEILETYLTSHEDEIDADIEAAVTLKIEIEDSSRIFGLGRPVVIFDADALCTFSQEARERNKKKYDLNPLTKRAKKVIVPKRVFNELNQRGMLNASLTPASFKSFLRSQIGIVDIKPNQWEIEAITKAWKNTRKGSFAAPDKISKFEDLAGEVSIIAYCLRHRDDFIIVVSNDSDVRYILRNVFPRVRHVRLVNIDKNRLRRAA